MKARHTVQALATLVLIGVVAGCVVVPTQDQIAAADHGAPPRDAEATIKAYMLKTLIDPDSVKYDFLNAPVKSFTTDQRNGSAKFGYLMCVNINSKNRMGGYTGNQLHYFVIRNDRVTEAAGSPEKAWLVSDTCQRVV